MHVTPAEVAYLAADLSGGAASMAFLYSTLGTVNVTGTLVDLVADQLGLAPNLVAIATARPTWDADLRTITGNGVNARLAWSANNAAANFATLKAIVTIGTYNDANNLVLVGCVDALTVTRDMNSYNGASNIGAFVGLVALDSAVAKSATRRAVVVSHNGSTTSSITARAHTAVTGTITALAAGNNRLTIFDYFPGGGANTTGPWRATLGLTVEPTAGDLTVFDTWAVNFHDATIAA